MKKYKYNLRLQNVFIKVRCNTARVCLSISYFEIKHRHENYDNFRF